MRYLLVLAAVALFSGCICCGGKDFSLPGGGTSPQEGADGGCEAPYLRVGSSCCLDDNDNGICDNDDEEITQTVVEDTPPEETEEPTTTSQTTTTLLTITTTQVTQPTLPPTTTQPAPAQNPQGTVMKLNSGWQEYEQDGTGTGYLFRFDEKEGVANQLKYWLEIKTPDGITDRRPLSTGESFVDFLRFKVTNYGEDIPIISIRKNIEDLTTVAASHPDASLLTLGGQSCWPTPSAMCERNYQGYTIQMINRFGSDGQSATLGVTPAGMGMSKVKVSANGITSPDGYLIIGGFFDNSHYINGGYNLFYVYHT
ncbi:MAG: hypothetical protein V1875_06720 [Candidatus Altiarchaeota archaeon]